MNNPRYSCCWSGEPHFHPDGEFIGVDADVVLQRVRDAAARRDELRSPTLDADCTWCAAGVAHDHDSGLGECPHGEGCFACADLIATEIRILIGVHDIRTDGPRFDAEVRQLGAGF